MSLCEHTTKTITKARKCLLAMKAVVLSVMKERHKACMRVSLSETPSHVKNGRVSTSRQRRGAEWMTHAASSISQWSDGDDVHAQVV